MIKINLGQTKIQQMENLDSRNVSVSSSGASNELVATVLKVALLLASVGVLYFFEQQNLDQLNAQMSQILAQKSEIQMQVNQAKSELDQMGASQNDSKVLEDKLKLLRELSRKRLREIKSLDYIQSVIPTRLWLLSLKVNSENYIFSGRSMDQSDLSLFVRKLESGGVFSDVVLVKDAPIEVKGFALRDFEILARSEVVN